MPSRFELHGTAKTGWICGEQIRAGGDEPIAGGLGIRAIVFELGRVATEFPGIIDGLAPELAAQSIAAAIASPDAPVRNPIGSDAEHVFAELGVDCGQRAEPIGYYLRFDDNSFIEVVRVSAVKPEGRAMHFAIETDDIDGLRHQLLADGYAVGEKTLGGDQTWLVTCQDPSGILIELQQYGENSMQFRGGTCLIDYKP